MQQYGKDATLAASSTNPTVCGTQEPTAICVTGEARAPALLAAYPGTRAILTRPDGTAVTLAPTAKVSST